MIKRDELVSPDSCLNKASHDEPIFVLRAHDATAIDVVLHWCALRITGGKNGINDREIVEALEWCGQALKWRSLNG